jgi:Protein of unknown function (DUF3102)
VVKVVKLKLATKRPAPKTSPEEWAARISARWQDAAQDFIETGKELIAAKADLGHGAFLKMIEERLPFSARKAQMLMRIAENPVLSNTKHVSHLPPSWGTLYRLTELPDRELEQMLTDGRINADSERKDVDDIIKSSREEAWSRLVEALETLIEFSEKWPNAAEIAKRLDDAEGGWRADIPSALPAWIQVLHDEQLKKEVERREALENEEAVQAAE